MFSCWFLLFGGLMIIVGIVVGVGMFFLFIVMFGIWFGWLVVVFLFIWFCMLLLGMMIFEVNFNYLVGLSFLIIICDLFGQGWNVVNGLSIVFVFYIFIYVYIFGGGLIIGYILFSGFGVILLEKFVGLLFVLVVVLVVWWSICVVDCIIMLMFGGMIIMFGFFISGLFGCIQLVILFNSGELDVVYWFYLLVILLFCLIFFGYYGNVLSLMKYYGKDLQWISCLLWIGILIVLVIYLLWQVSILGIILCEQFKGIIVGGSNVGILVEYLYWIIVLDLLNVLFIIFFNLVVVSFFFGVIFGLFDYLVDLCKFDDSYFGCFKIVLLIFVLLIIGGLLFFNGFIYVIGFVGLVVVFWVVIVLVLMVWVLCKCFGSLLFCVWGGMLVIVLVLLFGVVNVVVYILVSLYWLLEYC